MMRRLLWLLVLAFAGCSKCGSKPSPVAPVERWLPRGAVGVVVAPSVAGLGARLAALEHFKVVGFLAPTQGFPDAKAFADALVGQLGVDLRKAEALEQAGLDANRGLGVVALVTAQVYLVLPVKDAAKFEATFASLAQKRLGADVVAESVVDGVRLKTYSAKGATSPRAAFTLVDGFAFVATEDAVRSLPAAAKLGASESLAEDRALDAQRKTLGSTPDLWATLPKGSPVLARAPVTSLLVHLALEPLAFSVLSIGEPKPEALSQFAALVPKAPLTAAGLDRLPTDAFLHARFAGDPATVAGLVQPLLGTALGRVFADAGFDWAHALSLVKPGVVMALSLADRPPLGQGVPTLDLRRTNPFDYVHLTGLATVTSSTDTVAVMNQVAALAPRFGADMKASTRDDVQVWLTSYAQGEGVHFALKGDAMAFGAPVPRVRALVEAAPHSVVGNDGLGDSTLAVSVDFGKLRAAVRALPESAWGIGGFALKGTTLRWLDATDDLVSVRGSASFVGGQVLSSVVVSFSPEARR